MPQYYNLSQYGEISDLMGVYAITDNLMTGMFSLFLVIVLGSFMFYVRTKRGDNINDSLIYASFFSMMLGLVLYIGNVQYSGMLKGGLYIYLPALILVINSVIKWYQQR